MIFICAPKPSSAERRGGPVTSCTIDLARSGRAQVGRKLLDLVPAVFTIGAFLDDQNRSAPYPRRQPHTTAAAPCPCDPANGFLSFVRRIRPCRSRIFAADFTNANASPPGRVSWRRSAGSGEAGPPLQWRYLQVAMQRYRSPVPTSTSIDESGVEVFARPDRTLLHGAFPSRRSQPAVRAPGFFSGGVQKQLGRRIGVSRIISSGSTRIRRTGSETTKALIRRSRSLPPSDWLGRGQPHSGATPGTSCGFAVRVLGRSRLLGGGTIHIPNPDCLRAIRSPYSTP